MYALGTVFYGSRTTNVNLWIIDKDNSYEATMMWDGLVQRPCVDLATAKRATMGPKNIRALENEILAIMGSGMTIPNWVLGIISKSFYPNLASMAPTLWQPAATSAPTPAPMGGSLWPGPNGSLSPIFDKSALIPRRTGYAPTKRFQLPPELRPLIEKNLGMSLTDEPMFDNIKERVCDHVWKDYFGFTDNYHYCEKCNEKMRMKQ